MAWIKTLKDWEMPNQEITPEDIYLRRREFLSTTFKFSAAALGSLQLISPPSIFKIIPESSENPP